MNQQTKKAFPAAIQGLHHFAYRCRDAEETRHFYEDLLGLPFVCTVWKDHVPSTGEYCPYFHLFFEMKDGSYVTFFDLGDNKASIPDPHTPAWVNHLALEVDSVQDLERAKKRLEDEGIKVLGITDHEFIHSIYFFDPNGIRLELTARTATPTEMERKRIESREQLKEWTAQKKAGFKKA